MTSQHGRFFKIGYLPKVQARKVYSLCQEREEAARQRRHDRMLEEKRAGAGGIVVDANIPAVSPSVPQDVTAAGPEDPVSKLKKLKQMLDAGLIDQFASQLYDLAVSLTPAPKKTRICVMDTIAHLDRMLDPVVQCFTPEVASKLTRVKADPELQSRIDELADKCTEGELTDSERVEYETYVRVGNLIAVLQAKARKMLIDRGDT